MSGTGTIPSSNCSLMSPLGVTISHGGAMYPLVPTSCYRRTVNVGGLRTYDKRKKALKQLHKQFLGTPVREHRTLLKLGHKSQSQEGKTMIFCCQRRSPFLQAYMQFNEIAKFLGGKLQTQNTVQWHSQYKGIIKAHLCQWREGIFYRLSLWREGIFFVRCAAYAATMVVLAMLFVYGKARTRAYIDQRILPCVATVMGDYLGRKLNLGRVQRVSPLGITLDSCSLGPHSEEFSCGEFPNVRLHIRPLASLKQRQIVLDAVLVEPHVLIAQKEDWTWLGIPTPVEKPLEKHRSNEEGIDARTKTRRLAREQAALHKTEERKEAARRWAQRGYIFADGDYPRMLGNNDVLHQEEMFNCDSMNCSEEEVILEKGFVRQKAGREEKLHHRCTEGACNISGMGRSELERGVELDDFEKSFNLKIPVLNVKLWLNENMVSPIRHQFGRSAQKNESSSQKAILQRRNLNHSAEAARRYFEKVEKRQNNDAEDGGGYPGEFGMTEDSQKCVEDQNEENGKCVANNRDQNNCPQVTQTSKEVSERNYHVVSGINCLFPDSVSVSFPRLGDVPLLNGGIESVGHRTVSEDQSLKQSSTNAMDNAKGSIYEASVNAFNDNCETTESCKPFENHYETRSKELVHVKSTNDKDSFRCSNMTDKPLQKIAGDLHSNHAEDVNIAQLRLDSSAKTLKEREGKNWIQNKLSRGSSPVLASLITYRDITQAKSAVNKNTKFRSLHESIMTKFSDNFNTLGQRMEQYLRNKFEQPAAESVACDHERVQNERLDQLLPVALDSVIFRGGTLMLLAYGDNEPRVVENINGYLKFQNRHEQIHLQLSGRAKEWRTLCPSKDGGKLFVNAYVDYPQQKWHVNLKAKNLFAPLFERLLEIPIVWSNGRASGEVHICMSKGDHFPKLHGQLDVKGLEFQVLDAPSSFSALHGSLCFRGQRVFLHNASCTFGDVPLEVSGDFGINPEDGEFHLMCQVPNVEVNALMRTLKARPPLFPVAGYLKAVFNCQGPLDVPVFVGSAVILKPNNHDLNILSSAAYESVRQNKDAGAVAAIDRVPFSYVSANFTFNTDNCMADLYGIRATLVDGGEIRGAGNAWICQEGEMDDSAVDVNFSGNVHFENVVRHYAPDGMQVMPVKLGDMNVDTKVFGSILRPRYDIKWAAPKAEGSFTDARGDIILSHEAITINASSITFDLATKIQIAYPNLHHSKEQNLDLMLAAAPDIKGVDADLRLRGFDILGLNPFGPIGSPKPTHMKLTGRTKFQGHVVKSYKRSHDNKVAEQEVSSSEEWDSIKASGLEGEVFLSGIKLNQLLVAPQLAGSLDIFPQYFKLDATGRPDENLHIEIIGPLHLASLETSPYDLFKRKVSLSLQKGQLRTNIFVQPGHSASLEARHVQLDELELASLRGMVQKAEVQLNFQKRRGQGQLSVMRPRFSGVQGESLDLSARWSGDVITIEKSVLEQAYSRYELQGEYVLPGTRDRFSGERDKGGSLLKRAMAGQLGNLITSMGRWRLKLEVPGAEVAEMLPFARLLSRSSDPAVLSRSKELFMQGVHDIGFHAESLKKQLEAAQGNIFVPTDEETPEAVQLPALAELKGRWHGNFDASGGGNGDTTADFDFHGEDWEWGAYKMQRVVAVGSYSNNDGFRLDRIFIQRNKATLHADGTLLGPRPNLHFAVLNFPVGLVPTLLQVFESSIMNPMPSLRTPLTPIRGILHMEGDLRGSTAKPQCDVQVRLLDGAIGGVDLRRAEVVASITSANRFEFDANFEPVIQTGHVHIAGSLPVAPLGTDALVEEDTEKESNKPMWAVRWMRDKGKIISGIDLNGNKFHRERGGWEVQLTESLQGLDWNLMETGAVNVDATVKDGGMMLITALSPYVQWHQGSADITLQVRGTVDHPIFDGAATFHRASVYSPVLPTPLSNFGGTFHVKSNQLCINGLEGRVGRKGRLLVKGSLPLRSSRLCSGDKIEMKTEILEVRAKNIFSGQVDSQIEVAGSILEPDVSGMIKLSRGEAYLPQDKGTGAAITRLGSNQKNLSTRSFNQMRSSENIAGFYRTQSSSLPLDAPARAPDTQENTENGKDQRKTKPQVAVHLQGLKLHLGPELRIVYPLILNFAVSGELELNGLADPKWIEPKGTLTFEDGDVTLLATQVRLKRDHLNRAKFEPDQGLDPTLDLALVGADWQLKVQGRASKWQDNLVVTSPRSGEHDVLSQDEAARVFESQLAESLLEGDGQLAFQKLAAATLKNLMPRIEVSREFGQARWKLVSAPQIPNLLSLDPTVDPFKSLANLSFGAEVEVQLGKHLQASVVRQLKESEMATQWTLLYQLSSRLRILFQSNPSGGNRLLFQYSGTSQN